MSDDLISRAALDKQIVDLCGLRPTRTVVRMLVHNAPAVDAEPVRHGHWIAVSTTKRERIFKCSVCRNVLDFDGVNAGRGDANRCPCCGARMDEKEENYDNHN